MLHGFDLPGPLPGSQQGKALPDLDLEQIWSRTVEITVLRALFPSPALRLAFIRTVGPEQALNAVSEFLPLRPAMEAFAGPSRPESECLKVGFVPVACATPLMLAHAMGIYSKHGLRVEVEKTTAWATIRNKSLTREYDAAHMLSPMPVAMTLGLGTLMPAPFAMSAVENVNGQAITLALKHKACRDPQSWKGFKLGVPFAYSMHNYLLRYYLAEHGVDPDRDVQIVAVPPEQMPEELKAGLLDGYLAPEPMNQRAVYDGTGFIHLLSKEIWNGHPCCAYAMPRSLVASRPAVAKAFLKAVLEATVLANDSANRKSIAALIAPDHLLGQPVEVVEAVLTGNFEDGLGNTHSVPDRIGFDHFPWHSFAIWILTQMKRWGQVKGDLDYQAVARQVFLATGAGKLMHEAGAPPPARTSKKFTVLGREFDPDAPEAYLDSFPIKHLP